MTQVALVGIDDLNFACLVLTDQFANDEQDYQKTDLVDGGVAVN